MTATEFELLGKLEQELEEEAAELQPLYTPWRVRQGLRPKPQYLRFLNLDQFIWNKASLTPLVSGRWWNTLPNTSNSVGKQCSRLRTFALSVIPTIQGLRNTTSIWVTGARTP